MSKTIDPGEAFLLGLLHDIGKLALLLMPKGINSTLERLAARGCQISAAELVLCGFDHGDAGAEVLRHWKFADELIEAVEHHHEPERSEGPLASLLYLAEFWTDSDEDLPSNARLNYALKKCNLTAESMNAVKIEMNTAISNL
ncbi:MAG: HDOD domain-containing protein, partial [Acidobacteriaceae bacterium]|nr:HDOD domain-containing protein [Acidobacteriaceae bacterium]